MVGIPSGWSGSEPCILAPNIALFGAIIDATAAVVYGRLDVTKN